MKAKKSNNNTQRRSQAERRDASSRALLNAAIELIAQNGSRVSLKEIALRAGFSHGLLMTRFGSKQGLIKAVIDKVRQNFMTALALQDGQKQGLEALTVVVDTFFRLMREDSTLHKAFYVLLGEAMGPDQIINQPFRKIDRMFRTLIEEILQEAAENNQLRPGVSPGHMSVVLVSIFRGLAIQNAVNPGVFDIEKVKGQMDLLLLAIEPRAKTK